MLTREEITRSLTAAWALFLDRPGAMRGFDVSVDGFWRSFAAVILVVPSHALAVLAEREMAAAMDAAAAVQDGAAFLVQNVLGLGLDWVALPVILALLARPLGIARHYPEFVVARNWGAVIAAVPFGAIGLLIVLGLLGGELANLLMLAALIVVLRYMFIIARRALDASLGFAIGIVVLDFVVSLTIALALDAVFAVQALAPQSSTATR
jgi:hypothetical protein